MHKGQAIVLLAIVIYTPNVHYIEPPMEQIGITSYVFTYPFSDRLPMRSRSPLQFFMKQREMIEEGVPNRRQRGRN